MPMSTRRQPPGRDVAEPPVTPRPRCLLEGYDIQPTAEVVTTLLDLPGVRIERIVSLDHVSPADFWYDQHCHEWVMVIAGCGEVEFDNGRRVRLVPGDALELPARCKHRVSYTDPETPTIWVAVRVDGDPAPRK